MTVLDFQENNERFINSQPSFSTRLNAFGNYIQERRRECYLIFAIWKSARGLRDMASNHQERKGKPGCMDLASCGI